MMKSVRHHAWVLLGVAFAVNASAEPTQATNVNATSRATAVAKEDASPTTKAVGKIRRLVQATEVATQELRSGFDRFQHICEYGGRRSSAPAESNDETPLISPQIRNELRGVKESLEQVLAGYKKNSRITRNDSCKYLPEFLLASGACQGFQDDRMRLAAAESAAKQLINQAQERLDLYEQYWRLEHQGCMRAGFTKKLWIYEEKYLWPGLMEAPLVFKSMLPSGPGYE